MNKTPLILISVMLLLLSTVYASCNNADNYMDSLFNFCNDATNNYCDDGEIPYIHKDCKIDTNNFGVFEQAWFYKLIVVILLFYIFRNKHILKDRNLLLILLFIMLLLNLSERGIITPPIQENNTYITVNLATTTTTTQAGMAPILELGGTEIDKRSDGVIQWIENLWPEKPMIGYIILGIILIFALPLITKLMDGVEKLLNKII